MSFLSIKQKCLEEGGLYEDEEFPARNSSLFYDKTDSTIEWKRPRELSEDPQFTLDGANKHDLDQGEIGNCWFLAAAATLSTQPDLFERVLPLDQSFNVDYCGAFHFNFWRYGEWVEVVIDDRLPTRNGELIYCHNCETPNEFWSALLEKAYAKLHGSYQALEAGLSHDALVDFTGGIGEEIDLKNYPQPGGTKLFIQLKRLAKRNSLLCAAIYNDEQNTREVTLDTGLVAGHAYSITDLVKLDLTTGKKARLIRVRNPWGRKEWTGDWCDGCSKWEEVPEEMIDRCALKELDDGEFWMSFSDFMKNFHAVQICHLTDQPKKKRKKKKGWSVHNYDGEWIKGVTAGGSGRDPATYFMNPQYFCVLADPDEDDNEEQCTLIVSLMQKYARRRKTVEKRKDTEEAIGFDLFKFKGETPEELDGFTAGKRALRLERKELNYKLSREVSQRFLLEPGTYCVLPNTFDPNVEAPFLLRFATETKVRSGEVGNENVVSAREKPDKKRRKFDELFDKHAGEDNELDARELRKLLNEGFLKNKDEDFSKETCRELIHVITGERRGLLDKSDSKAAWKKVKNLQDVFKEYDQDSSDTLDARELRNAFKSLGFQLGKKAQGNIVKKYCDRQNNLSLDDFVLVTQKMANSKELFTKMKRRKQRRDAGPEAEAEEEEGEEDGGVELTQDEYVEMSL